MVYQDELAAQETDIAILARQTGLPWADVERAIAFQQTFVEYADEMQQVLLHARPASAVHPRRDPSHPVIPATPATAPAAR